ncbi:MAG: hypothetical protein IJM09_05295, partial [Neisseriaceae bacterium]|nr:hypothetical protein [Neisseriaceae bacterium]
MQRFQSRNDTVVSVEIATNSPSARHHSHSVIWHFRLPETKSKRVQYIVRFAARQYEITAHCSLLLLNRN